MTATMHPLDPAVFAGLRKGDEAAFERLFHDRYPAMLEVANGYVSDSARAARVVENTLLGLWEGRDQVDSAETAEAWLEATLHDSAVREKGRLAGLHRFAEHEGVHKARATHAAPTVEAAWKDVSERMHGLARDAGVAAHMRHDESRHNAAEHMAAMAKKPTGGWIVLVIGLIALVVMGLLFWLPSRGIDGRISRALADPTVRELASDAGQRGAVTLGDGTQATMGPSTRFTISPNFTTTLRVLKLEGTSTFSVAKNDALPFMVRAGKATITATGTTFEVSAYLDEPVTVRVRTGAVSVRVGKDERSLGSSESLRIGPDGNMLAPSTEQLDEALGWVTGQLSITDMPIKGVLPLLKRWYALDVLPPEALLLNRRVTIRAGLDSARVAMTALEQSGSVLFDSNGKKWILRDVAKK